MAASTLDSAENPSQKHLNLSSETGSAAVVDRISNLPDSIICHILSLLPTTKDAVGTSILSRRWKFLWTEVPNLLFDFAPVAGSEESLRKFEQFVNRVLLLSVVQNILEFRLHCGITHIEPLDLNTWITVAITRNVRVLKVNLSYDQNNYIQLPSCLFACRTLEDLEMSHLDMNTPSLVCLPRLKCLKLEEVLYSSDESASKLISGCPVLEFLHIARVGFDNVTVFVISSRSLKELLFHTDDDFPQYPSYKVILNTPALESLDYCNHVWQQFDVNFESITSLVRAKLDVMAPPEEVPESDFCNSVMELVQALHHVKILTLSQETMKALSYATSRLSPRRFERLTKLVVTAGCCEWACLQDLLEVAVNLEVLEFSKADNLDFTYGPECYHKEHTVESCWKDPEQVPRCLTTSLKQISFELLDGLEDELAMIGYILKYGSVLNQMLLSSADSSKKFELIQKIRLFPRTSPACQIAFQQDS